ncbi:MAG: bifunctional metallophosphatase/5'-nucleotidase [Streptosporangiaceae bacterium]
MPVAPAGAAEKPVNVQLLAITDFHGYLAADEGRTIDSPDGPLVVGGAAYLAGHVERLRTGKKNSILLSVGDDFSGWPDYTQAFANEPTVEFLNRLGLDLSTAGNHEFDRQFGFLQRMMDGSCFGTVGVDSCFRDSTGQRFQGARYDYHAANITDPRTGEPVLGPYYIAHVSDGSGGTVPVGIISVDTVKTVTSPMSFTGSGLDFGSEVRAVNTYAAKLQRKGVKAIVVAVHQGGSQEGYFNQCKDPSGPVFDMAERFSPAVDAIFAGHWHTQFRCMVPDPAGNPRPVMEGAKQGKLISEIDLAIDPATGDVVRGETRATNHPVIHDVPPVRRVQKMVDYWVGRWQDKRDTAITTLTDGLSYATGKESPFGNLVADIVYAQTEAPDAGDADLALVPPGMVHGGLSYRAGDDPADADGRVLFEEAWHTAGQAPLVTVSVTGATLDTILEQQWQSSGDGTAAHEQLSVSKNVQYAYDPDRPVGERVDPEDVVIGGQPLDPDRTYRVATDAYTVLGKRGFPAFTDYTDAVRQSGPIVLRRAVLHYLRAHDPVTPPDLGRVTEK